VKLIGDRRSRLCFKCSADNLAVREPLPRELLLHAAKKIIDETTLFATPASTVSRQNYSPYCFPRDSIK